MSDDRSLWEHEWPIIALYRMKGTQKSVTHCHAALRLTMALIQRLDAFLTRTDDVIWVELERDDPLRPVFVPTSCLGDSLHHEALAAALAANYDICYVGEKMTDSFRALPSGTVRLVRQQGFFHWETSLPGEGDPDARLPAHSAYLNDADLVRLRALTVADGDVLDVVRAAADRWPGVARDWLSGRLRRFGPDGPVARPLPRTREVQLIYLQSPLRAVRETGLELIGPEFADQRDPSPGR